jgi:5-methylcytosine-specific restriction endonuclease McrA
MSKFELEEYHRNVPPEDLIADLKRVACKLGNDSVTINDYDKNGKYHSSTLMGRLGPSWFRVLERAGLKKTRNFNLTEKELIDDLIRVVELLKRDSLTQIEYRSKGNFGINSFIRKFGSWFNALEKAGLKKTRNFGITNEQYFENLEKVWVKLGRQPHYNDMRKPLSEYVGSAYEYRFGTWRKSLEQFIEYVKKEEKPTVDEKRTMISEKNDSPQESVSKPKTARNPSWRLRFLVMKRDNFACKYCGWSPAKSSDPKKELEVDHIIPWPKGETVLDNLQTLCSVCNIGKSNLV